MVNIRQALVSASIRAARTYSGTSTRTSLTFHETANTSRGADADAHARLQAGGNSRKASWQLQVDDREAVRSFPNKSRCWHAGWWARNSIAIEVCVNADGDVRQAWDNAIELAREIRRDEPTVKAAKVHRNWTGKNCPTFLLGGRVRGLSWTKVRNRVMGTLDGNPDSPASRDEERKPAGARKTKPRYPATLRNKSRGYLRELWQRILVADGYDIGPAGADGVYGDDTEAATKDWQRDRGLTDDGVVGPATWTRALMSDGDGRLRVGDRGPHVELWQHIIRATADGVFGPKTKRKGKRVQRFLGVKPDSIPGPNTADALVDYWT